MRIGLLAEFADPAAVAAAVRRLRGLGYTRLEVYSPYALDDLDLPAGRGPRRVAAATLAATLLGAAGGYALQWWTAQDYPLRVGAMPVHAMPAYVPIAFETMVLGGALGGLLALALVTGLPRWWDQAFTCAGFERASADRFLLAVDEREPRHADGRSAADLAACAPIRVAVPGEAP